MDGYRLGPAQIDVASDDAGAARWLREFLIPWFEACPPGSGEFSVRLSESPSAFDALERRRTEVALAPRACFALDSQVVELPAWSDAEGEVAVDARAGCFYRLRRGRVEIVARPGNLRIRVGLMRVVRELAALRMLGEPGCLDLHAAAFAVKDRAVLLVGPKRAGKTTLLVNALTSGRAELLANDRVLIAGGDTPVRVFGIPTLVSIRPDTLERLPSLESSIAGGSALLHAAEVEAWSGGKDRGDDLPARYSLSPAQLAQQLGAGMLRCAPIAAIVFPEISAEQPRWSLARIAAEEARARLAGNLYGARLGPRTGTVFEEVVAGGRYPRTDPAQPLVRLSAAVPSFACRLGPAAYQDGADAWLNALPL